MRATWTVALLLTAYGWGGLAAEQTQCRWQQTDTSLELWRDGHVLWALHADPADGKPWLHPLNTPSGFTITDLRPADHRWHRAAWFAFKEINGVNYWEEDPKTGRSQGSTEVLASTFTANPDFSATVRQMLRYVDPKGQEMIREDRTMVMSVPGADGRYSIDWTHHFQALTRVLLDRTHPPGEAGGVGHGGYAGLSLRLNKATLPWHYLDSEGRTRGLADIHGRPARWLQFSGTEGAITVFDYPGNRGYPTFWFIVEGMPYISPAFIFHAPITLAAGSELTLRYRMLITPQALTAAALDGEAAAFATVAAPATADAAPLAPAPAGLIDLVARGQALYATNCEMCHAVSATVEAGRVGPAWWGLAQVVPRQRQVVENGHMAATLADDGYLEAAIRDPMRQLAVNESGPLKGQPFLPVMPPFPNLSGTDIGALLAYMKTLNEPAARGPQQVWVPAPQDDGSASRNELVVRDRALVQRVIVKGFSPRAFSVGLPGGFNYIFDPDVCTVKHAWAGGFINVNGERTGRGNTPNRISANAVPIGFSECLAPVIDAGGNLQFRGYERPAGQAPILVYQVGGVHYRQQLLFRDMYTLEFRIATDIQPGQTLRMRVFPEQVESIIPSAGRVTDGLLQIPAEAAQSFSVLVHLHPPAVPPRNLAIGATATSPGTKDGDGIGPQGAIDGDPTTYWDETNDQKEYRLRVQLPAVHAIGSVRITGFKQQEFAPKDFRILVDGKEVRSVANAQYTDNHLDVPLDTVTGSQLELVITGYYGHSPAIRELEINEAR